MAIRQPRKEERFVATYFETVAGFENKTDVGTTFDFKYTTDVVNKAQQLLSTGFQSNSSGTTIETTDKTNFKINGLVFINGNRNMIQNINIKPMTNAKAIRSNEAFEIKQLVIG